MSRIDYEGLVGNLRALNLEKAATAIETLTRELAKAEKGVCTDCEDTGITIQTEKLCACHAGNAERLGRELADTKARLAEAVGLARRVNEFFDKRQILSGRWCAEVNDMAAAFLAQQEAGSCATGGP